MDMVIVYHGTTVERAERIIKDQSIFTTSSDIARYDDTEIGYVYVTKRLCDALDFSTRPPLIDNQVVFVVFKIYINENELLPDYDEAKHISTLSHGGEKDCFRIKRKLRIGNDVVSVYCKRMYSNSSAGEFMQKVQYNEISIQESEWKKPWEH